MALASSAWPAPKTPEAPASAPEPSRSVSLDAPPKATEPFRIAVVDLFYPGDDAFASDGDREYALMLNDAVDIDGDGHRDPYYHGDIVGLFASGEGIEIVPYRIDDVEHAKTEILSELRRIQLDVIAGNPLDAVVLSWESSTLLKNFGTKLSPDKRGAYKAIVKSWGERFPSWQTSYEIILALEALADAGLEVYTIAGNSGAGAVNTYSFAEGVHVIGGVEPDHRGRWIADNALVAARAKAAFKVRFVIGDSPTVAGYDIDEDGLPDIPVRHMSGYKARPMAPPRQTHTVLKGSSYAAPTALKQRVLLDAGLRRIAKHLPGGLAPR